MSTLSREEDTPMDGGKNVLIMPSEESSSYPDESELELGLGLSLGSGSVKPKMKYWDHRCPRVLTAEDFQSGVCTKDSISSSSSSSSVTKASNGNGSCGVKRTAEPSSPPGRRSQVVGWPPVPTYRMNNSISNYGKSPVTEDFFSSADNCLESDNNNVADTKANGGKNENLKADEKGQKNKASLFVKVNMDGMAIGRKVDLNAHSCYGTLAFALDDMFAPSSTLVAKRQNVEEQFASAGKKKATRLLDASSDYVLTYEDKDGDWMLVGDVPWEMFLSSVRRLRIMKRNEANGLAPKIS